MRVGLRRVSIFAQAAMQLMAGIDPTIDVDRKGKIKDRFRGQPSMHQRLLDRSEKQLAAKSTTLAPMALFMNQNLVVTQSL
eukprot:4117395-Amphidinium_carterae.1